MQSTVPPLQKDSQTAYSKSRNQHAIPKLTTNSRFIFLQCRRQPFITGYNLGAKIFSKSIPYNQQCSECIEIHKSLKIYLETLTPFPNVSRETNFPPYKCKVNCKLHEKTLKPLTPLPKFHHVTNSSLHIYRKPLQ